MGIDDPVRHVIRRMQRELLLHLRPDELPVEWMNQRREGDATLLDEFIGLVTGELEATVAHELHRPVAVVATAVDHARHVREQRVQVAARRAQRRLELLASADLGDGSGHADEFAVGQRESARTQHHPDDVSVGIDQPALDAQRIDVSACDSQQRLVDLRTVFRMHHRRQAQAAALCRAASAQAFPCAVDVADAALAVRLEHHQVEPVEHRGQFVALGGCFGVDGVGHQLQQEPAGHSLQRRQAHLHLHQPAVGAHQTKRAFCACGGGSPRSHQHVHQQVVVGRMKEVGERQSDHLIAAVAIPQQCEERLVGDFDDAVADGERRRRDALTQRARPGLQRARRRFGGSQGLTQAEGHRHPRQCSQQQHAKRKA